MSGYVAGAVWNSGPNDRSQRFVLLAIADNANDEGFAWPSVALIAKKCLLTESYVIKTLKKLVDDGWVSVEQHPENYKRHAYQISLDKLTFERPRAAAEKKKKGKQSSPEQSTGEQGSREQSRAHHMNSVPISHELHASVYRGTVIETSGEPNTLAAIAGETVTLDFLGVIDRVFAYYIAKFEKNPKQYTLTPKRRAKAILRLKERTAVVGFDAARREIKLAIDNLAESDYHMSNGYTDWIDQIFKSAEEFEKRVNWKPAGGSSQKQVEKEKQVHDTASSFAEVRREYGIEVPGEVLTPRGLPR